MSVAVVRYTCALCVWLLLYLCCIHLASYCVYLWCMFVIFGLNEVMYLIVGMNEVMYLIVAIHVFSVCVC